MPVLAIGLFLGGINVKQALVLVTAAVVVLVGGWTAASC